jgi:hypothetical protein
MLYSLLCLELPLHIAFKKDMLAVSTQLLTARLDRINTPPLLLARWIQPPIAPGVPHHLAAALKQRCQHTNVFCWSYVNFFSALSVITVQ